MTGGALAWRSRSEAWQSRAEARLLGTLDFVDEPEIPVERLIGRDLDGRLFTDLSTLTPATRITPTEKFYIRTSASSLLPDAGSWRIQLRGFAAPSSSLSMNMDELRKLARPCGTHLMECSGNVQLGRFGLMSVAEWEGVPLARLLEPKGSRPSGRVLVSGFDSYTSPSVNSMSMPGASWIFSQRDLASARAFLATAMNGQPLSRNHGAPVRLVVPGWYGCCCIKWVNEIALVPENTAATLQMQEFASRTHQAGIPALAREFEPAVIDPAAMPVRVEKWLVAGKVQYRVMGILWGARGRVNRLEIQFKPGGKLVPVTELRQTNEDSWSFWTHIWTPAEPGRYTIRLRVADPRVRTRRLDSGHYQRTVAISEI